MHCQTMQKKTEQALQEGKENKTLYKSTKLAFFTSNKDKTPLLSNSGVIYNFSCPGCKSSYIGKTENTLHNRTKEHAWNQKDIANLFQIDGYQIDERQFRINCVQDNTEIIRRSDNWLILSFLELLAIKDHPFWRSYSF